jgi:hypothetical protein
MKWENGFQTFPFTQLVPLRRGGAAGRRLRAAAGAAAGEERRPRDGGGEVGLYQLLL